MDPLEAVQPLIDPLEAVRLIDPLEPELQLDSVVWRRLLSVKTPSGSNAP